MKKLQFLILFCTAAIAVSAQNQFLLYSFKGNVSVIENNVESKAKVGKPLNAAATVKVAAGGAVTLIWQCLSLLKQVPTGLTSLVIPVK